MDAPTAVHRGIALIAVLWIVAALGIAVIGITQTVRSETRAIAGAKQMLEAQAKGEAAAMLALQDLSVATGGGRPAWRRYEVPLDGQSLVVEVAALNGFVDINRAPTELLSVVLSSAGGRNEQGASALAQAIVQSRQERSTSGQARGFEAVQDLMRVEGMDYDLYARLRPLLTADAQGSGKINPQAAPLEVLTVLAEGNATRALSMVSARAQGGASSMDTTTLRGEFIDSVVGSRYRVQALVPMSDGFESVVTLYVDINPDQRSGLPWRIFNAETWMRAIPVKDV